ncbi:flagellar export chaperone FlgN [Paenibacillus aceris]|uniref:Flagellar biosynthesis/type III secretory pathway chaperone n=1 Tax=Paenibacillus aceris TaxID=869555 RepID=A0ABS4I4D7_9BACL|nr:flagellar biosynthesis/type III secretory pathway chaperone [Paenibacillus aceris]NHW34857.1 flagellar protein FlgN [Paenibacillus aceris]
MSITAIVDLLNEMTELHEELVQFSLGKRNVIMRNDVNELAAIVKKEAKLIKDISDLDQKRVVLVCEYMISRCYQPNPSITLSDFIKIIFKAEEKLQLLDARNNLELKLNELKEANLTNKQLVKLSLNFIDLSLDLLTGSFEQELIYKNPNQQHGIKRNSTMFDSRI